MKELLFIFALIIFGGSCATTAPSKKPTAFPTDTRFPTAKPTTRYPSISPTISQNPTTIYPTRPPTSQGYATVVKYTNGACSASNAIIEKTMYVTNVCAQYYDTYGNTSSSYNSLMSSCSNGVFSYTWYPNNDCVDRGGAKSITYNTNTCLDDFVYSPLATYSYIDDYVFYIECTSSSTEALDTSDLTPYGAVVTSRQYTFESSVDSCPDSTIFAGNSYLLDYCYIYVTNQSYVYSGKTHYFTSSLSYKYKHNDTLTYYYFSNNVNCEGAPYLGINFTVNQCSEAFSLYSFLTVSGWKSMKYTLSNLDFVGSPSALPSVSPTRSPSTTPSVAATLVPTLFPSCLPTISPTTRAPTRSPTTRNPTLSPTSVSPTASPTTLMPTWSLPPTECPTALPSITPSSNRPTLSPSVVPTVRPSVEPTIQPSTRPTVLPSLQPSVMPTVSTLRPSCNPSKRPTVAPTSMFPTGAPSVSGWITRYSHYGAGCHYDNVVRINTYKSGVCLPYYNHFGNTTSKRGYAFGSKLYTCKDGVVVRYEYDSPDCVDLRKSYSTNTDNNTVSGCTVSSWLVPYDDWDPYYYSYQCYSTREEAMSTVNMTGSLITWRDYSSGSGCINEDITRAFIGKIGFCYFDMYNTSEYINGKRQEVRKVESWMYSTNHSAYYEDTAYCDSKADEIFNFTAGECRDVFTGNDDFYYTSDHTYELATISVSGTSGAPSRQPSRAPTSPTRSPTLGPTATTALPSAAPSYKPTTSPSRSPSLVPSTSPSANPSVMPTANPSIVPTNVPSTVKPTVTPTSSVPTLTFTPTTPTEVPTESPTEVPSVHPSNVPTDSPTVYPTVQATASPSLTPSVAPTTDNPTTGPTLNPSGMPSLLPSVSPSHYPTVSPSALPSMVPSRSPSAMPSVIPSAMPLAPGQSAGPTVLPSAVPTMRPTLKPSVSPTLAPTPQSAPILSFSASTTLNGMITPDLDQAAQDSIVNATASSMGIDSQYVNYTGCTATPDSRRLSISPVLQSVTYSVVAHTDVIIPMAVFIATSGSNITDASALYITLTAALSDAMNNGQFLDYLTTASVVYGSSSTVGVTSTSVEVSEPTVMNPPTGQPTKAPESFSESDDSISGGALIGVIVGPVAGVLLLALFVWYCFFRSHGNKVNPTIVSVHAAAHKELV